MYLYIYILFTFIYMCIGGWGCESNREIVFVSFVRACERSCVCPRDVVAPVAGPGDLK